mmetsp:Transcript_30452/g.52087  ORF Transcript_30452/g.52087 Transcript_30452/m.52087 type:complete len:281 (+) Transcript_30452:660-1502(+)
MKLPEQDEGREKVVEAGVVLALHLATTELVAVPSEPGGERSSQQHRGSAVRERRVERDHANVRQRKAHRVEEHDCGRGVRQGGADLHWACLYRPLGGWLEVGPAHLVPRHGGGGDVESDQGRRRARVVEEDVLCEHGQAELARVGKTEGTVARGDNDGRHERVEGNDFEAEGAQLVLGRTVGDLREHVPQHHQRAEDAHGGLKDAHGHVCTLAHFFGQVENGSGAAGGHDDTECGRLDAFHERQLEHDERPAAQRAEQALLAGEADDAGKAHGTGEQGLQ